LDRIEPGANCFDTKIPEHISALRIGIQAASPRTPPGRDLFYVPDVGMAKRRIGLRALPREGSRFRKLTLVPVLSPGSVVRTHLGPSAVASKPLTCSCGAVSEGARIHRGGARAGWKGGGSVSSPRCARIATMTARSGPGARWQPGSQGRSGRGARVCPCARARPSIASDYRRCPCLRARIEWSDLRTARPRVHRNGGASLP